MSLQATTQDQFATSITHYAVLNFCALTPRSVMILPAYGIMPRRARGWVITVKWTL